MSCKRAKEYIFRLKMNESVIQRQLEGLSNEDALLQPEPRGNCANWILGHITNGRSGLLKRLGEEPIWTEDKSDLYERESSPITGPDSPHLPLDSLWEDFKHAGELAVAKLETLTDADLDQFISEDRTLAHSINFSVWHEAYHTGQFEFLRQLTGVNDKVI